MAKTISLNILYNYPVRWGTYRVLRDFVQNFYDAKPAGTWWEDFHYEYDPDTKSLVIVMENSRFSYEWLLHIGASSKTGKDAAGYFGEGFKIAALCAVRDLEWDVTMSSGDWAIHVIGKDITLDGTPQKELAYELEQVKEQSCSSLVIRGISGKGYGIFKDVLMAFFYPENPLFGKRIYENQYAAVYARSDIPIPDSLPSTVEFGNAGAVFVRRQMLGTLPFPCVVALHPYEQLDRERRSLYDYDVLKILYLVAGEINPSCAKYLLEQMPDKWNALPKKQVDISSWYYVVCQLIRTMCMDEKEASDFKAAHPELLYVRRFIDRDIPAQNRRRIARAWLSGQPGKYKLVIEQFYMLGYPELEEVCEKAGGFADRSSPEGTEVGYLAILHDIVSRLFADFYPADLNIPVKVIRAENAGIAGLAETQKLRNGPLNSHGIRVRQELLSIAIREECLQGDKFDCALSVYLHEMAHIFGGDNTQNFSFALTKLIELVSAYHTELEEYRQRWESIAPSGKAPESPGDHPS